MASFLASSSTVKVFFFFCFQQPIKLSFSSFANEPLSSFSLDAFALGGLRLNPGIT